MQSAAFEKPSYEITRSVTLHELPRSGHDGGGVGAPWYVDQGAVHFEKYLVTSQVTGLDQEDGKWGILEQAGVQ